MLLVSTHFHEIMSLSMLPDTRLLSYHQMQSIVNGNEMICLYQLVESDVRINAQSTAPTTCLFIELRDERVCVREREREQCFACHCEHVGCTYAYDDNFLYLYYCKVSLIGLSICTSVCLAMAFF